jgi:hypothetical protein
VSDVAGGAESADRTVLDEMARRVIDRNFYMVLGTLDPDGQPRLSPVFFTAARYEDFYWVSVPDSHHSRNVAERPDVRIVVFDSSLLPGETEAVYATASARMVPRAELADVVGEAFRTAGGAVRFTPEDLSGDAALRLFVARATSFEVHVRGRHPTHGRGYDSRQAADPRVGARGWT